MQQYEELDDLETWEEHELPEWELLEDEELPPVERRDIPELKTPLEVLRYWWGYEQFRPMQEEIITSVLEGRDTMGLLPTGGGKSLTFQVPGLLLPHLTLVITPLISLMKDQVDQLRRRGIKATTIHSGISPEQVTEIVDLCRYGGYKFLYISPERLQSPRFRQLLSGLELSLIVVDECHCISQWGYDFRPSYQKILDLRPFYPDTPVLALTATATKEVVQDICHILGFSQEESRVYEKSFYRENLSYSIRYTEDKEGMLLEILHRVQGSGIVYCRNRMLTERLAAFLRDKGIMASSFHAGLPLKDRALRQEDWLKGRTRVMVATNAFGMGIDKPDVRLVVHYTIPSSLEEYYQEAGRAGRDGLRAYAVALIARRDHSLLERRLSEEYPERSYIHKVYESLCNYLGIGEGEGLDRSYDFDLEEFIFRYRMRPIETRHAIEVLDMAGVLEYKEHDSSSLLKIMVDREALYHEEVGYDALFRLLLRSYTGIFSSYVQIREKELSEALGMNQSDLYELLLRLSARGLLHYIPKKEIPRIVMRSRREDARYLQIPRSVCEERRARAEARLGYVSHYIRQSSECRSSTLLRYFGQKQSFPCQLCDVCLRRKPREVKSDTLIRLTKYLEAKSDIVLDLRELSLEMGVDVASLIPAAEYLAFDCPEKVFLDGLLFSYHA